jgi:hypothetical protein
MEYDHFTDLLDQLDREFGSELSVTEKIDLLGDRYESLLKSYEKQGRLLRSVADELNNIKQRRVEQVYGMSIEFVNKPGRGGIALVRTSLDLTETERSVALNQLRHVCQGVDYILVVPVGTDLEYLTAAEWHKYGMVPSDWLTKQVKEAASLTIENAELSAELNLCRERLASYIITNMENETTLWQKLKTKLLQWYVRLFW